MDSTVPNNQFDSPTYGKNQETVYQKWHATIWYLQQPQCHLKELSLQKAVHYGLEKQNKLTPRSVLNGNAFVVMEKHFRG